MQALGVMVRAINVAESAIFPTVLRSTMIAMSILLLLNCAIVYASWVAFIKVSR